MFTWGSSQTKTIKVEGEGYLFTVYAITEAEMKEEIEKKVGFKVEYDINDKPRHYFVDLIVTIRALK